MAAGAEGGEPGHSRPDGAATEGGASGVTWHSDGPGDTEELGAQLSARLSPGDVVLVRGELGAGKTTLVRGAARALGVRGPVTSPTFSIGHRYQGTGVTVSHLDLYRLASLQDEVPELLDDYLGPERIAFVEWPERGADELAAARVSVTLLHAGGDRRTIEVTGLPPAPPPGGQRL